MKYKVLQFKDVKKVNYAFMDYDFAQQHGFTLNDYEVVYEDSLPTSFKEMNIFIVLDALFTKFNIAKPSDFTGHSMSVSDLIALDNGEIYYVDSIGFQPVTR